MNVKITTANCEVINSGLVTSFNGEPISITLLEMPKPITLIFSFNQDESTEDHSVRVETSNDYEIILRLTNFNNPLGTGTIHPIGFATNSEGKNLYINFYVYLVGRSSSTLHYTIYKDM